MKLFLMIGFFFGLMGCGLSQEGTDEANLTGAEAIEIAAAFEGTPEAVGTATDGTATDDTAVAAQRGGNNNSGCDDDDDCCDDDDDCCDDDDDCC